MSCAGLREILRVVADEQHSIVTLRPDGLTSVSPPAASANAPVALIVIGENAADPQLFELCAAAKLGLLLADGWIVEILDVGVKCPVECLGIPNSDPPGRRVAMAISSTERLRYLLLLCHARRSINLTARGDDLVVTAPIDSRERLAVSDAVRISQLRLASTASNDGWVDAFGCLCRPDATWPLELACALGWPVRTVYPGYAIYFPHTDGAAPISAIPWTRALASQRMQDRGWVVWLPNAAHPIRVSAPRVRLVCRYGAERTRAEKILIPLAVALQPIRDWRATLKRRIARVHRRDEQDQGRTSNLSRCKRT